MPFVLLQLVLVSHRRGPSRRRRVHGAGDILAFESPQVNVGVGLRACVRVCTHMCVVPRSMCARVASVKLVLQGDLL